MSCTRRHVAVLKGEIGRLPMALALLAVASVTCLTVSTARASVGYAPRSPNPVFVAGIEFPHGLAVDQVSHHLYVAVTSDDAVNVAPGRVLRFESNGNSAGTFLNGSEAFFSGVAVNPLTQGIYAAQVRVGSPLGSFGTAQMDQFSSTGVMGATFPLSTNETLPQIATDSTGDVYFPNAAMDSVQVFSPAGVLQETISCSGCPGGAFGRPASVAIDSEDNLYVADIAPDRVIKLTASGGSYGFDSVLQSNRGAAAVGVDPSTDDVFVGDFPNGRDYHVVAYDSSGSQFDDFGAGMFINPPLGVDAAAQIAADAATHRLYLGETDKIYVFERGTIGPPSATANPASSIGQVTAALNATVNANGHAVLECEFELTEEADVGFADATSLPCPSLPVGSSGTALSAKASALSPDTAYRFRVTATSNGGSVSSTARTFETLPEAAPTVTTASPTAVTQVSATIKGNVNPQGGLASSCHFDLGTSVSYGASLPCAKLPEPVATDVAEALELSGLAPGTTYHYRLVVSTNAGTAEGDDIEFTTVSAPSKSEPGPGSTGAPPAGEPVGETPPLECGKGFRRELTGYGDRCVRVCKKGFRRKVVRGKARCVRRRPSRARRHHTSR